MVCKSCGENCRCSSTKCSSGCECDSHCKCPCKTSVERDKVVKRCCDNLEEGEEGCGKNALKGVEKQTSK